MPFNFKESGFYNENSILDISMIIKWNKKKLKYNFDSLPLTAIISLNKYLLPKKKWLLSKRVKGLLGDNYILNDHYMYCSNFGNGAPAIIGFLEELRELGVKNFVFIGLAGTLVSNKSGDNCFILEDTFSTSGCTVLYSPNKNFRPNKNDWYNNLKLKLKLNETIGWSTDAPYRETASLISYYKDKKVTHVDMESASIYAFAEFYELNAMCIIVTADNLENNIWSPPKNLGSLKTIIRSTIENCLKI